MDGAAPSDDTPTVQMLSGRQQLTAASGMGEQLTAGAVLRCRYLLQEIIGRGGSSTIFRATDRHRVSLDETAADFIAVKVLHGGEHTDPLAIARLQREFRQMQCLSHPAIVRVFDLDRDGNVWFMSMELVVGRTVKTWMQAPESQPNALRVIGACCNALEHAHSLGIVHGDLKPSNVMVADNGAVKLIDFGSAPDPDSRVAAASDPTRSLTPLYASPQVLGGHVPGRLDDVFSLACLSYSVLSRGQHPFGKRPSLEDGRAKSAPTYVRAIPAALFEVIERGLSAEPERRPASVMEFRCQIIDADRRRRGDAGSAAKPICDNVNRGRRPSPKVRAVDRASGSLPIVFQEPDGRAWGATKSHGTDIVVSALDRVGGNRASYWRAQPFMMLIALVCLIAGAAVLIRHGSHRDMVRAAELPTKAAVTSPEPLASAGAQTEADPRTTTVPHESGVISFEAPMIHASALQPLVAISVKRLRATERRGAFTWRVEHGTALPGVDYQWIEPQVVRFSEGQAVRTLFIPLISSRTTLLPRGPRTFTVTLEQVAGGPALGRLTHVTVALDPPPTSSHHAVYQALAGQ